MNNHGKIKIFFFEVHPLMILGVKALIEKDENLELCGHTNKHETLIDDAGSAAADVVILDLPLYAPNNLDFIRKVRRALPDIALVVLSVHAEADYATKAQDAGADGYVLKSEEPEHVLQAVRAAANGEKYISPKVRRPGQAVRPPSDSPINLLSEEEFRILQLVGKGRTNRQIAEELDSPAKDIERRTETIQDKLGLSNPVELLQFAFHWVHHEGGFS